MWKEINEITQSKTPTLIEFYTSNCSLCTMLGRILEEVQSELGEEIQVKRINIDEEKVTTIHFDSTYQIMGVPTIMLFKEGKLLWRHSGVLFKEDLVKEINPFLS